MIRKNYLNEAGKRKENVSKSECEKFVAMRKSKAKSRMCKKAKRMKSVKKNEDDLDLRKEKDAVSEEGLKATGKDSIIENMIMESNEDMDSNENRDKATRWIQV